MMSVATFIHFRLVWLGIGVRFTFTVLWEIFSGNTNPFENLSVYEMSCTFPWLHVF